MDTKITKTRLSRMLSYDWLKIVGFSVAAIIVWTLIFTMTATRITPAQEFTVLNYAGNLSLSNKFFDSYNKTIENGVFSYEVIETNNNDLTASKEYLNTVLEARFTTDEGDVLYVSLENDPDTAYKDENDETQYNSYYQSFLNRWFHYVHRLDGENGYFAQMESYLNMYYTNGYTDAESLDTAKVEADFRARIKENKDKRFKKESQIEKGVQDEIVRIQKYRDALVNFNSYLAAGYVEFTEGSVTYTFESGEQTYSGMYAINLCPNVETMGGLQEYVSYYSSYEDENGTTQYKTTAENMQIVILDLDGVAPEFKYESLLYINSVIESYCTELNK
ncbi:MAG: hypothetical protein E7349_00225 [Clostridiales bacterium]|nr:hypothetical protein [Clostridiales bacterium]